MTTTPGQIAAQRLFTAAERSGVAILQNDRDQILGFVDSLADSWLDRVVSAVVNNLPKGGIKNVEWGPIKSAVLSSEPEIDTATNQQIAKVFDGIVATLSSASAKS